MTRTRLTVTALALAVALTGCGDSSKPAAAPSPSASSPSPTPAATSASPTPAPTTAAALPKPPVDGGKHANPLRLIEALSKGGIDCLDYQAVASPTGAVARGSCYVTGEEYTVGIYKSEAQARQQPKTMADLLEDVSDVDMVLGQNWTVGCPDQPACRSVARVLGGEVFHQPM